MKQRICFLIILSASLMLAGCHYGDRTYNEESYLKEIEECDRSSMIPASNQDTFSFAPMQELPLNPSYTIGVLDNGLTYYIFRNESDREGIADIELVVKAGSLIEEDDEQGIAHFVEHMVFGGSKHYPGNAAMETMRRYGVAFGNDLNAKTNFNSTSFELHSVPVKGNAQVVDTCLHLLRDWASECTMDDQIVERERAIILEEIRYRNANQYLPRSRNIWAGTRYANHLPIGTVESVSAITGDAIRRYYHKWYQPQNMAVLVYGDIDKDKVEAKIKQLFSDLERGENPIPHYDFRMQPHTQPRAFVYRDKTASKAEVLMTFSIAADSLLTHRNTLAWFVYQESKNRLKNLINGRLERIHAELPIFDINYNAYDDAVAEDSPFTIDLMMEPANWSRVVNIVSAELEKIRRYGFTEKEARSYTLSLNCTEKMSDSIQWNADFSYIFESYIGINPARNHFVYGDFLIDGPSQMQLTNYCNRITAGYGRSHLEHITADNRLTISVTLPEDCDITQPDRKQILEAYDSGRKTDLEADKYRYAENPNYLKLAHNLTFDLQPGELKERSHNYFKNTTQLTLSNGVVVDLAYSDNREFSIQGVRYGAMTNYNDADAKRIKMLTHIEDEPNSFAGAGANLFFEDEYDTFKMRNREMCGEDMLKVALFKLCNTAVDSTRLANYKQLLRSQQPMSKSYIGHINELWSNTMFATPYSERVAQMTPEEVDAITLEDMEQLSQDYRSNFNGMHFVIFSTYPSEYIEPLIIKYLGMLPSKPEPVTTRDIPAMHFKVESGRSLYTYTSEKPNADILLGYIQEKDFEYSVEQHVLMEAFKSALGELLVNHIRLKEANVYSFNVDYNYYFMSGDKQSLSVFTPCDTAAIDGMLQSIDQVIHEMAYGDLITESLVENYINNRMKSYDDYPKWFQYVDYKTGQYQCNGKVVHTQDKSAIKSVTPQKLRQFIKSFITNGYKQELVIEGRPAE